MARWLSFCIFVLAGGLLLHSLAHGQAVPKEYALSNYDVSLSVRPDGAYDVRETIRLDVQSGTFRTMHRAVKMRRLDSLTNVAVTSPAVAVDSLQVTRDEGDVRIQWTYPPRAADATFEIRYRAHGGLRTLGDRNVLKWVAVGSGWPVPIRDVDVQVRLPAELDLVRDAMSWTPESGTLTQASTGWTASFRREALEAKQGYAVEVTFPARIDAAKGLPPLTVMLSVLLALVIAIGLGLVRWARADSSATSDPPERAPTVPLPEAARLLGDARSSRMHNAVLFDLARRGHLTLSVERSSAWLDTSTTVSVDVHPDRFDLSDFERAFLDKVAHFKTLSKAASKLRAFRKKQRTEVRKRLVQRGWLCDRRGEQTRYALLCLGCGIAACGAVAAGIGFNAPWLSYVVGALTGGGLGTAFFIGSGFVPTDEGERCRATLAAYVAQQRRTMDRLRVDDPAEAARRLPEVLPWLLLDAKVTHTWLKRVEKAVEKADTQVPLPTWLRATDDDDTAAIVLLTSVVAASGDATGAAGVGAGAAGVAGAGAAGAAGGGGGGAG